MASNWQESTALRDHIQNTGSRRAAIENGALKLYSGTIPADADAALGGATLIVEITRDGSTLASGGTNGLSFESALSSGALIKLASQTWSGTVSNGSALDLSFFRWIMYGDTGNSSTTEIRFQGTIGTVVDAFDMIVSDISPADASTFTLPSFVYRHPRNRAEL